MSTEPRLMDVTFESKTEYVDLGEELARGVAGTVGFDEDEQYKIGMAVREVLINALEHGNRGDLDKPIGLRFSLHGDRLEVEVRDQGQGFDLAAVPDPRDDEHLLKTSGRGLFLARCFVDDLRVEAGSNDGAKVVLTKHYNSHHKSAASSTAQKERPS
jgi:serine/threonine-protein kinase RsbW